MFTSISGQVAIQNASLAFAAGCHSIVFTPGYQSTVESPGWASNSEGISIIERSPDNDWQIDPSELRAAIKANTKYMIINEPHNPGNSSRIAYFDYTEQLLIRILSIAFAHQEGLLCQRNCRRK